MLRIVFKRTVRFWVLGFVVLTGCRHAKNDNQSLRYDASKLPAMICSLRSNSADEVILKVSLRYSGATNITFFPEILPWYQDKIALYAVDTTGTAGKLLLREPLPAGAMWFGKALTVTPGQVLEGEIPLHQWFPEITEAIKRADVLVFWSYPPPRTVPLVAERQNGIVVIPRRQ